MNDEQFTKLDASIDAIKDSLDNVVDGLNAPFTIVASAALDHASFTDNGDATCKISTGISLPVGAVVDFVKLDWADEAPTVNGSAGETTVTATIGDATGGDVDRLGAALATTIATGLPASIVDTPVGDAVYASITAVWLHLTLSGGTPDAGNFVAAGGSGKATVTIGYRATANL